MAISPFMAAINQICDEKGLSKEVVIETVKAALAAAYRKEYGNPHQVLKAELDPETSQVKIYQVFQVVKKGQLEDKNTQMILTEAKKYKNDSKIGEEILIELPPRQDFGRIAAQTAKQVILQRIREAERNLLFQEFKQKEGKLLNGVIQQVEGGNVIVDLGKASGLMIPSDQVPTEKYYPGQRLKVYLSEVEDSPKGPKILVSRSDPRLIAQLFLLEVPEIASGVVMIKSITREPGSRSKIAVSTNQKELDPVGSCVGQRGTRVQAVLAEIGEEKIDIILWDSDPKKYIANSLSPAKIKEIELHPRKKKATVKVDPDQLSLAIGKGGQNVRLASKLTEWNIDIVKSEEKKNKKGE